MKVFYILLNRYLPYNDYVISTRTRTNGFTSIFNLIILISSPINLICDYISTSFVIEKTSTFSYSWIVCDFFFFLTPSFKVLWFL